MHIGNHPLCCVHTLSIAPRHSTLRTAIRAPFETQGNAVCVALKEMAVCVALNY